MKLGTDVRHIVSKILVLLGCRIAGVIVKR